MNPDHYYGQAAAGYEAQRAHKPCWQREQQAVAEFVTVGPVLDCPVGTGRYLQIYKDKGLDCLGVDASTDMMAIAGERHPDVRLMRGNVLELPFKDGEFATAVCSRLLPWLFPGEMVRAIQELARVAAEVVASIRLGRQGRHADQSNYTHSMDDFLYACEQAGLVIADERHILSADDGEFMMFRLRRPFWADVAEQFQHHHDGEDAIKRLTANWVAAYSIAPVDLSRCAIKPEYWDHERLNALVLEMARTPRPDGSRNNMITTEPPRYTGHPLTVLRSQGREAILDGRRRANQYRTQPGRYPVLVIEDVEHVAKG